MNKILNILVSLLVLFILSSCDLREEKVWVFVEKNDEGELLKVNSITKTDKSDNLHIKSIMDVYNKEGSYKHTFIFHMIISNDTMRDEVNTKLTTGPLTILTNGSEDSKSLQLNSKEQERVKNHILSQIREIKYK